MKYSITAAVLLASSALATHTTTVTKTVYVTATAAAVENSAQKAAGYGGYGGHHGQKPKTKKTVTATVTSTKPCNGYTQIPAPAPVPEPKTEAAPVPAPPKYTHKPYRPPTYNPKPDPKPEPEPESEPEPEVPSYNPPTGNSFADQCVSAHNKYRAMNGAPPVRWSEKLVQSASRSDYKCKFDHMSNTGYGENLAMGYSDVSTAIKKWYDEKSQYSGGGFSTGTGHYTQVVWKKTREIGCVLDSCNILRCQYNPPGNYAGQYSQNV